MLRAGHVAALLCLLVVAPALSGCLAGPADPTDGSDAPTQATPSSAAPALAQQDQFDRAEYTIAVSPNGSVRWTLTYRRGLENDTEVQNFREYAERFNQNETDLFTQFRSNGQGTTATTGDRIGRDMAARDFQKHAEVRTLVGTEGVVRMSFVWTNFARVEDDQLYIGDVFEGGISIFPNQVLSVRWSDELSYVAAEPEPDDFTPNRDSPDAVTWRGGSEGRTFDDRHPQVRLTTGDPAAVTTTNGGAGGDGGDGGDGNGVPPADGGLPGWFLGLVVILALVFVAGAFVAYRTGALDDIGGDGSQPGGGGAGGAGGGRGGRGAAATPTEPAIPDEELMSDEDRVMDMLEQNGGRMKQVNIVDETGWSKSKVSMLLSDMEDDGQISKLRVGRENIISKAGSEPEGARSPFDDDN